MFAIWTDVFVSRMAGEKAIYKILFADHLAVVFDFHDFSLLVEVVYAGCHDIASGCSKGMILKGLHGSPV